MIDRYFDNGDIWFVDQICDPGCVPSYYCETLDECLELLAERPCKRLIVSIFDGDVLISLGKTLIKQPELRPNILDMSYLHNGLAKGQLGVMLGGLVTIRS